MVTYKKAFKSPTVEPTATIYIDGLLALCFNGQQRCTVAVNKQPDHDLVFEIHKYDSSKPPPGDCTRIFELLPTDSYQRVEIQVKKLSMRTNEVKVYSGSPVGDRDDFANNCVDLEGKRGHSRRIKNKLSTLWPRFYIDDGLFYAYKLSTDEFSLKPGVSPPPPPDPVPLKKVALAIVADIFLKPGETIEIIVDGKTLKSLDSGSQYQIGITNVCSSSTTTSDFNKHYQSLDVSVLHPAKEYTLDNLTGLGTIGRTQLGPCIGGGPFSDRVPCMAVVFGQTEDFID